MKVFRHIAWLLLICFSAFLGHNLVPHHHHAENLLYPLATDCPFQHNDQQCCDRAGERGEHHHDDPATHCHAFNDVVFEKFSDQLNKPQSRSTQITAAPASGLVPLSHGEPELCRCNGLKFAFRSLELYGSLGLRGPPRTA